jgi:hypothetical protein
LEIYHLATLARQSHPHFKKESQQTEKAGKIERPDEFVEKLPKMSHNPCLLKLVHNFHRGKKKPKKLSYFYVKIIFEKLSQAKLPNG